MHRSLVEPLLDEDASSAERALLALSSCLGSVHAATIGHAATFERIDDLVSKMEAAYERSS